MTDWDHVTRIALALPLTTLGSSYGTPSLKVRGKLLARLRDDGVMTLKVEDGLREALLDTQPEVFFTTEHYTGYPVLLVRLDRADAAQIATLVQRGWGGLVPMKLRNAHALPAPDAATA
ncbi:MAG: MmcQ/YjbR family DNA-binding protein [Polymorphobacter sp.]